jgi:hypothetical protein
MSVIYELFDRKTANVIGTYDSAEEALRIVSNAIDRGIADQFTTVALGREDDAGDTEVLASGQRLIQFAKSWSSERPAVAIPSTSTITVSSTRIDVPSVSVPLASKLVSPSHVN